MRSLHDTDYRAQLLQRIQSLKPDSSRRWGKMTVDQMLWHVNDAMALSIGELTLQPEKLPIPRGLLKFIVLNLPWGKGGPTHPAFVAKKSYDFATERARCLQLINRISTRDLNGAWPEHPAFGPMTGKQVSKLQAKHLNHHLTQFGV